MLFFLSVMIKNFPGNKNETWDLCSLENIKILNKNNLNISKNPDKSGENTLMVNIIRI